MRCHGLCPALRDGDDLVCSACGAAREPADRVVVIDEFERDHALAPPSSLPWYAVLTALIGAGVLWYASILTPNPRGRVLAELVAICLVLGAAVGVYFAYRSHTARMRRRRFELEQRIVGLAHQREGVLTVQEVATKLGVRPAEADVFLTELAKLGRATLEVSDGRMRYVFREAKPTRGIRIRTREHSGAQPISRNKAG